jgi:hypothetical protein
MKKKTKIEKELERKEFENSIAQNLVDQEKGIEFFNKSMKDFNPWIIRTINALSTLTVCFAILFIVRYFLRYYLLFGGGTIIESIWVYGNILITILTIISFVLNRFIFHIGRAKY